MFEHIALKGTTSGNEEDMGHSCFQIPLYYFAGILYNLRPHEYNPIWRIDDHNKSNIYVVLTNSTEQHYKIMNKI